jgi:glycosyltransferase involved in cell wall biosynthesis
MEFSFVICTAGENNDAWLRVEKSIHSIQNQYIPNYEIIVIGGNSNDSLKKHNSVRLVDWDEEAKPAWTTRKKNIGLSLSKYENVVLMHDYFELDKEWYQGFLKFGNDWDIAMTPRVMINGRRQWTDWAVYGVPHHRPHHFAIRYDCKSKHQYVDAAYFVVKRRWMTSRLFNEELAGGDPYDVEWSRKFITEDTKLVMNTYSIVRHTKKHINTKCKNKFLE